MRTILLFFVVAALTFSCGKKAEIATETSNLRKSEKGYANFPWQMDSIYSRLHIRDSANDLQWKAAISPHDSYKMAGRLYHESMKGINAPTLILIGVAHSARNFKLQDKIIFGSFTHWESPYGMVKVSSIKDDIIGKLPAEDFIVHDSMQIVEHSLEAFMPWIHRKNREVQIVPILVPYINYETIDRISNDLAKAVDAVMKEKNWTYGKDIAVVISNDAVHYGDEEWGGKNMAPYGTDEKGTQQARQMDLEIIDQCLKGDLTDDKVKKFTEYTVQQSDYKEYKWVWCGRYSVPFGLAFANKLNRIENGKDLTGAFKGYQTSIDHELLKIDDLQLESKALTTPHHWVAYVSVVYE